MFAATGFMLRSAANAASCCGFENAAASEFAAELAALLVAGEFEAAACERLFARDGVLVVACKHTIK